METLTKEEVRPVDENHCFNCGAQIKIWKHRLTPGLVRALVMLSWAVKNKGQNDVEFGEINMTFTERNNFQKLRYWGLVAHPMVNGVKVRGRWLITRRGAEFLHGRLSVPSFVSTWRNHIHERSEKLVSVSDITKDSESGEYFQKTFPFEIFKGKVEEKQSV